MSHTSKSAAQGTGIETFWLYTQQRSHGIKNGRCQRQYNGRHSSSA